MHSQTFKALRVLRPNVGCARNNRQNHYKKRERGKLITIKPERKLRMSLPRYTTEKRKPSGTCDGLLLKVVVGTDTGLVCVWYYSGRHVFHSGLITLHLSAVTGVCVFLHHSPEKSLSLSSKSFLNS